MDVCIVLYGILRTDFSSMSKIFDALFTKELFS